MILSIIPMLFSLMWFSQPVQIDSSTVENFNIDKYLGEWWEIARYDNRFERGLDSVSAEYSMISSNNIRVVNRGYNFSSGEWKQSEGRAKLTPVSGRLRVSFFLWFYSDYNVMEIAPDYSWALVGSASPKYLWILSRTKEMPAPQIEHILSLARERGYDTSRLIYPKQLTPND